MTVSRKQLAQMCGVSVEVLDQCLGGYYSQDNPTFIRVIQNARRLGYKARRYKAKSSRVQEWLKNADKPKCDSCGGTEFKIIESRPESSCWQRIRECKKCGERYLTEERVVMKRRYIR